jgi:hypothetical protein
MIQLSGVFTRMILSDIVIYIALIDMRMLTTTRISMLTLRVCAALVMFKSLLVVLQESYRQTLDVKNRLKKVKAQSHLKRLKSNEILPMKL